MTYNMEINAPEFTIVGKGSDVNELIDSAKAYDGDTEIPLTEEHLELIADWYVDHAPEYNGGKYVDPDRQYQSFVDSKNDQ